MASTSNPSLFARGACMECRRLKTKCDRAVPCAPCVRRGCESICPSGLRARGSRNPGAEVEQLNRNIQSMTARIRQLEEALQVAHAQSSRSGSPATPPGVYGTLLDRHIPEFNSIAGSKTNMDSQAELAQRQQILNMMPDEKMARALLDRFPDQYGWVMQPISRTHLHNTLFKRVYSVPCAASNAELSALCSVFSLTIAGGILPAGQDGWLGPAQFHELSMTALRLDDVLADCNLATIEALALQCCYLYLASENDQIQRAWNYVGLTIRMAYSIGLHRDPKALNLDDEECRRRRRLFHEIIALDTWMCMILERPPSVQGIFFSTEMPYDTPETLGADPSFFRWKHDFCREALLPIVNEVACAIIPPTYSTVLRVDKLCRACIFPSKLQFVDFTTAPVDALLQSQQLFMMQELALMKLHKAEFLRALEEYPDDPFKSYASYSVQTILDSATSLLKRLRTISTDCTQLLPCLSCPWEGAIASLSYLAVFLRKFSNAAQVNHIYVEFEMGCKLVMDHAEDTSRISKLIPHAMELRRAVHEAAPHLTENLRRALSERRRAETIALANAPSISLEYPLGPRPEAFSDFPFVGTDGDMGSSAIDLGSADNLLSLANGVYSDRPPVAGDTHRLFDGAHYSSRVTTASMLGTSIRFEVPSSNPLGDDTAMFPFDGTADANSTSAGQTYVQSGRFNTSF